ncbi:MAG: guanylate kinase [Verrucomicrobiae bacterium]|nr:guanylate kinase [Verrucomicrobiae bacterium]
MLKKKAGILFLVSAPSGAGKTTLTKNLRMGKDFVYSISCTTRKPRPGEENGKDYYFLSDQEFEEKVQAGDFLEHARVHNYRYGTLKVGILNALSHRVDILMDVDIQGAESVRKCGIPEIVDNLVDIFIMPPDVEELGRRLRTRGTETEEEVNERLETARREMQQWSRYRYTMVSGSMEDDLNRFRSIVRAEQSLSRRLGDGSL